MPQPNNNMLIRDSKQFQFLNERNECKRGGFVCRIQEVPPLGRIAKNLIYLQSHPVFGPTFTPPLSPVSVVYLQTKENLIKSQYEMLKLSLSAQG
jgi:hypothetical protein